MEKSELPIPDWAEDTNCAITVCDADCRILYMNEKSRQVNARFGNPLGHNLMDYHGERAQGIIRRLLETGGVNCYTIEKGSVKKMIYQSAWRHDGRVAGLVEISMEIPHVMEHYVRN